MLSGDALAGVVEGSTGVDGDVLVATISTRRRFGSLPSNVVGVVEDMLSFFGGFGFAHLNVPTDFW